MQREPAKAQGEPATVDPASPREINVANIERLAAAHLRWEQAKQFSPEDLKLFAAVEIVTGHWTLRSERYDLLMAAFDRGPHDIEIGELPAGASDFYFVTSAELLAEHAIRSKTAKARAEACGGGRSPRPSEIACYDEVLQDVAPTEFARKERGYNYMHRGMAAGEGAMAGGNPIEMGALVFGHNVMHWSPERSAEFASAVGGAVSIAGTKYAKTVIANRPEPIEAQEPSKIPTETAPDRTDATPRTPAQVITGQGVAPEVKTDKPGEEPVSLAVLFGNYLEHSADAVRRGKQATSTAQGPALATATFEPYGDLFTGVNEVPGRPLHPLVSAQVEIVDKLPRPQGKSGHYWKKGSQEHAEIQAASDAIYALEARLERSVTLAEARKRIELDILNTKSGVGMPRCARCMLILEGFKLTDRTQQAERRQGKDVLAGVKDPENTY